MKKRKTNLIKMILVVFIIGGIASCVQVGDLQEETRTVQLGEADMARIDLDMGAGEFRVQGGAEELFEGIFTYNVEKWKPKVEYRIFGKKGHLTVSQGSTKGIPAGHGKNHWDIYLNEDVPIELVIDFGAGEGKLDLRGMDLILVEINMGVGDLTVDLSGDHEKNLDVEIDGGVGSATVYLPRDIGVRVSVDKGIGSVDARNFKKQGSFYSNSAYGKTDITINVEIDAGIGSIDLRLR